MTGRRCFPRTDASVLVGVHPIRASHVSGVIAIGVGQSLARHGLGNPPQTPVIAIGGQMVANIAILGIGFDAFAGIGPARHYYGMGLGIAIGGFTGFARGP